MTDYEVFTLSINKKGEEILKDLSPEKAEMIHMAVGVSGEAGELLDAVKKHVIYGKELDLENVIEEMGDIEFYLSVLRSLLAVSREEVIKHNMDKLSKRYPKGSYSNEDAINRADK